MKYSRIDLPNAYAVIDLLKEELDPYQIFVAYWMAFNSIYVKIWQTHNQNASGDRAQVLFAGSKFAEPLILKIITNPSSRFFVERTPEWRGKKISTGENGVLKITQTENQRSPICETIDVAPYDRILRGVNIEGDIPRVCEQILLVLYAIRNNTFHGGKIMNANDSGVLEHGTKILEIIVADYLENHK